jgi:hypothetical protein
MLGTLDYGTNMLIHATHASGFINDLLTTNDERPTAILLDRAHVNQGIDDSTRDRRLIDHKVGLFYLPAENPEFDKIEIVRPQLKYRWRRFVTWTKGAIDTKLAGRLARGDTKCQTNFS